jgi:CheY-like chemotaxis protein
MTRPRPILEILHVEDNPGDVDLLAEVLGALSVRTSITVARDGVEALERLASGSASGRPFDLVFLDLNLPRKHGREVLAEMKGSPDLKHLPVVVLSSSEAERDLMDAYRLHANCFVTKPVDLDEFLSSVTSTARFWLEVARLPGEVTTI